MNEYQETFKKIEQYIYDNFNEQYITDNSIPKALSELKQLVDKANKYDDKETPKKAKPFPNSMYMKICPNCDSTLEVKRSYCEDCGQALDWSDE